MSHEFRFLLMQKGSFLGKLTEKSLVQRIEREIKDPELRKKLIPDYTIGCKRILLSNDYYRALSQDNVDVNDVG